jgi:hypothetical protein
LTSTSYDRYGKTRFTCPFSHPCSLNFYTLTGSSTVNGDKSQVDALYCSVCRFSLSTEDWYPFETTAGCNSKTVIGSVDPQRLLNKSWVGEDFRIAIGVFRNAKSAIHGSAFEWKARWNNFLTAFTALSAFPFDWE